MSLCAGKLIAERAHFRLPSAFQKRACLSDIIVGCPRPLYTPLAMFTKRNEIHGFACGFVNVPMAIPIVMVLHLAAIPAAGALVKLADLSS